ncbi:hypothetical protein EX30DRAFT_331256 [Ascodesmis nigricans]|uniref:Outer spore wall protein RRT8 n=1 Tax=Ascodesmis nigricans TaxID=341454 RepID=A0A4S2MX68_9PEZI|nr:hypothetical protein EX30DRAFT_331256 [Ascodesmis nigricans]
MPIKDKVVDTAKAEAKGIRALADASLRSKTYLYPIQGIIYFLRHRSLWKPLTSKLAPMAGLSVGVIATMFAFTYVPQSILLTFVNGPLAFISTIALVLSESAAIITALSRNFIVDDALTDVFDGVLVEEDCMRLVSQGRELKPTGGGVGRLGKALKRPFRKFTPQAIIQYFLYLPLNFIPVIGTVMFIFIQGRKQGPGYHARYFQLKAFKNSQRKDFIDQRKPAYLAFGTVAMLLQMIPAANIFFLYTNTVGAALWAADMEKGVKRQSLEMDDKGPGGAVKQVNGATAM